MTRVALVLLAAAAGLWLLRRQLLGDPAPIVDPGWRDLERVDCV